MTEPKSAATKHEPRRPWTTAELAVITEHGRRGATALALELGRSRRAVQRQAARMGVSLRRPGERRGGFPGYPSTWKRATLWQLKLDAVERAVVAERQAQGNSSTAGTRQEAERRLLAILLKTRHVAAYDLVGIEPPTPPIPYRP